MQAQSTQQHIRNFTLYCGQVRHRRLPVIQVRWLDDRRGTCDKPPRPTGASNRGRKFPATPIYGDDARRILDALYTPGVHGTGRWASKWGPIRHRNRTVMEVAKGTGARIHELLLLRRSDIDFDTHQVVIRRGKGGKRRIVAILPDALEAVAGWLPVWETRGFGGEDFLFPVLEGPSRGGMLSQAYMRVKLHEAAAEAGVEKRPAPHQFRHGVAVELHRRHVPIGIIQRQLGHSSPATTGIYLAGISSADVVDAVLEAFA